MAGHVADRELTRFVVATREHDAAMRRLLRDNPMAGAISLSLEREPDYFRGADLAGGEDRTILVFENERLACMGRSTVREMWVSGAVRRVGYLAELRLDAAAQGRFDLVRRGYKYFQELDREEPAEGYFTSIAADNERARRLLESGRRGLPEYDFLGEFATVLIAVPRRPGRLGRMLQVEPGSVARLGEMVEVLNGQARGLQLATAWTEESVRSLAKHGLTLEGFQLVLEEGRIVACGALWDQRTFRQTVIRGYAGALGAARPWLNVASEWLGTPYLPEPGTVLGHAFLSPLAFVPGREELLPDLVASFFPRAAAQGLRYLTVGLPARDGRLAVLRRRFSTRTYLSRLYGVSWPGGAKFPTGTGAFFPEVALL